MFIVSRYFILKLCYPALDRGLSRTPLTGGGGAYNAPQANSQTNDRSETGEAALERSRRDGSKALLNFS